jgi:hypothetical protein
MRGGVLVSSVRLCEIYIALKYTQLAALDKKAADIRVKLFGKTNVGWLVIRNEKRLIWDCPLPLIPKWVRSQQITA